MLNKKKLFWIVWPPIVLVSVVYLSKQESSICDQFKPYYYKTINGRVVKRYDCDVGGRRVGCIDLLDKKGNKYYFNYAHEWKVYDLLEKGDSISKPVGTYNFTFYRNGELLGSMNNYDCSPPTQK